MQMGPFPGQRMFSVYDGPAFQQSNAYLNIYPTLMTGGSDGWMYWQPAWMASPRMPPVHAICPTQPSRGNSRTASITRRPFIPRT